MPENLTATCAECHKPFIATHAGHVLCSPACRQAKVRRTRAEEIERLTAENARLRALVGETA